MFDEFNPIDVPSSAIAEIISIGEELTSLAQDQMAEFDPFDGLMEQNYQHHVRLGIIQDPQYDVGKNRVDDNGDWIRDKYCVTDDTVDEYPFNAMNAVDRHGMRVSVVWVDDQSGGAFHNAKKPAAVGEMTQKIWLTFPNAWADKDRCAGSFQMPLPGTLCFIAMGRGDVGVYMGAVPGDKAKLPHLRLGDSLERHYSQSCRYITDQTTQQAYQNVLNKNVFKQAIDGYPRIPDDKPYEDNNTTLGALHKYHDHREIIASDGVSNSAKVTSGKHESVDGKRTQYFNTNLDLDDAIDAVKNQIGSANLTGVVIISPEGVLNLSQDSNQKHVVSLTTKLSLSSAMAVIKSKTAAKSGTIQAIDGSLTWSCDNSWNNSQFIVQSTSLGVSSISTILLTNFNCSNTLGCIINCNDAMINWNRRSGNARSTLMTAAALLVIVELIMGRPGKYFSVEGVSDVIVGSCPRTGTSINTCAVGNT